MLRDEAEVADALSIERIRWRLETATVGAVIYLFPEVVATGAALAGLAAAGAAEGTVVLAETQTGARSRRGLAWFSPPGCNLYAAALFRPPLAPAAVPVFSLIAPLALSDAVWAEGIPAAVKWPDDVLAQGRRVAATVVSHAARGEETAWVILDVAVNVNVERPALEAALGPAAARATSLREVAGRVIDRNALAAAFMTGLERWAEAYRAAGPDTVLRAWRTRDALAGSSLGKTVETVARYS